MLPDDEDRTDSVPIVDGLEPSSEPSSVALTRLPGPFAGSRSAPGQVPLRVAARAFEELEIAAMTIHTARARAADLRDFLAFIDPEGTRLLATWLRRDTVWYQRRYEKQPSTGQRRLVTLRLFVRFIERHLPGAFPAGSPTERIPWPKVPEPEWKGLAPDEVQRILAVVDDRVYVRLGRLKDHEPGLEYWNALRDAAIVRMFLGTGLRVGELVALDLEQLAAAGKEPVGMLTQVKRKGGRIRPTLALPTNTRKALARYLEVRGTEPGPLFKSRRGGRLAINSVWFMLQSVARDAGEPAIRLHPHLLRHTVLRKVARDAGLEQAALLADHTNLRTTLRYTRASEEELREVQEKVLNF